MGAGIRPGRGTDVDLVFESCPVFPDRALKHRPLLSSSPGGAEAGQQERAGCCGEGGPGSRALRAADVENGANPRCTVRGGHQCQGPMATRAQMIPEHGDPRTPACGWTLSRNSKENVVRVWPPLLSGGRRSDAAPFARCLPASRSQLEGWGRALLSGPLTTWIDGKE